MNLNFYRYLMGPDKKVLQMQLKNIESVLNNTNIHHFRQMNENIHSGYTVPIKVSTQMNKLSKNKLMSLIETRKIELKYRLAELANINRLKSILARYNDKV